MNKAEFDKNYNISYVPAEYGIPLGKDIFKHYFCSVFVYFLVYLLLAFNPYFQGVCANIHLNILYVWLGYVIIAPIILFIFKPKSVYASHNVHICNYLWRVLKNLFIKGKFDLESLKAEYYEKQSLMLLFIKVFFGTIMLSSVINNITTINNRIGDYVYVFKMFFYIDSLDFAQINTVLQETKLFLYHNIILLLYTIDLFFFVIGYFTELNILNNKVKMVETSALGVFACLICYPPFNEITTKILDWHQNENALAFNDINSPLTWVFYVLSISFLIIYTAASVALFTKASNLTNRGIVSRFPYNIVRHPAYICKNLCWFFTTIPFLFVNFNAEGFNFGNYILGCIFILLSWFGWAMIYYFRALTEERFLSTDPEYVEYCKKVKYKFIPYII